MLLILPAMPADAATAVYSVTASKVNIRQNPDTDSDILSVVRKGSDLTLIDSTEDGWLKVVCNGVTGYVSADYAQLSSVISGGGTLTAVVTASKLYIRSTPSSSGSSIELVRAGTSMAVTGLNGGWLQVSYNGSNGYVSAEYVRLTSSGAADSAAPAPTSAPQSSAETGTLKKGSTGSAVKALQEKLIALGYLSGSADGVFGSGTQSAVVSFQRAHNLTADGVAGASTIAALDKAVSGSVIAPTAAPTSAPAPAPTASPLEITSAGTLKKGSTGSAVKALQEKLIALGYLSGSADGVFGSGTQSAVVSFQRAHNLTADGVAGASTIAALNAAQPAGATDPAVQDTLLKKGSSGEAVKKLQQNLITLGFLTGEADGSFGSATKAAVQAFQSANGLTADGQAGEKTLSAIASAISAVSSSGTLSEGSKGDAVRTLQQKLIALGYLSGSADGVFGANTKKAVIAFQSAKGLTADGVAGSSTLTAINAAYQSDSTVSGSVTAPGNTNNDSVVITPSTPITSYPTLKYGMSGSSVSTLQTRLKELGYFSGDIGGNFGTLTRTAVMAFQAAANLTADGIVGVNTWSALYSSNAPTATASMLKEGDKGDAVTRMQTRLRELGFLTGTADGTFGANTKAALIAFQTAASLTADGVAGPQTLAALYASGAPTASSGTVNPNPGGSGSTGSSSGVKDTNFEIGAQIVALAKQYLGCKYVYAHENPPYFDCSGLTQYVYKQFGYSLKRTAYLQGYDDTWPKITSISDLQIGDLIYFNTNTTDSDLSDHAAIYMGDGSFIHASSSAGKVVINSLTSGYYKEHFSWGRRVLNQ